MEATSRAGGLPDPSAEAAAARRTDRRRRSEGARDFWEHIHLLAAQGLTFLITTHYMDEAERCHRLAYLSYGDLLTHGTVAEVIDGAKLITWSVSGPGLIHLAGQLRPLPAVKQAVAFGTTLHVSGDDAAALEAAIAPFRREGYEWKLVRSGLEDVFIHLMDSIEGQFRPMSRRFSITRFCAIIIKEFIQMRRDRVTFGMMVGIPLLQLTLFRLRDQFGSQAPASRRTC
jgi:hypothetical protein